MSRDLDVVIVGAGLAGLTAAREVIRMDGAIRSGVATASTRSPSRG